jgi:hypothetical protein
MDINQANALYADLNDDQKVEFLARIAFDLTIDFRDVAYTESHTPENMKKLQGINELQHHLTSQLLAHHRRDGARYPDQVFVAVLIDKAKHHGLLLRLQRSLERRLTSTPPV